MQTQSPSNLTLDETVRLAAIGLANHRRAVRESAAAAVAAIGEPAMEPLLRMLGSAYNEERQGAAQALALIGDPAVEGLGRSLGSPNDNVRIEAARALGRIGTESAIHLLADFVLTSVEEDAVHVKRSRRAKVIICVVAFSAVAISFANGPGSSFAHSFLQFALQATILGGAAKVYTNFRREAGKELASVNDLCVVGALAICLPEATGETRKELIRALKALLPQVRASDARLFPPRAMEALVKSLSESDIALKLAILGALEQIGDERAIRAVEPMTRSKLPGQLRGAAETCLAALRQRAEAARQAQRLLRPADAAPDTLLRPAAQSETNPAHLLRSVE